MTVDQIRTALTWMEENYSLAMDSEELGLAAALWDRIQHLQDELVRLLCAEDPYTTEADVRFFEGFKQKTS